MGKLLFICLTNSIVSVVMLCELKLSLMCILEYNVRTTLSWIVCSMMFCFMTYYFNYCMMFFLFFFNQKTAYEMLISDWISDVCSSDLPAARRRPESSRRTVGRHGQARRPRPRARARSRAAVSRRTDRRARPDRRRQVRRTDPRACRHDGAHRLPHHPRSRLALCDLRPGRRARGETGDRGRHHPGTACHRASVDTGLFQRTARPRRDDGARPRRARQGTLMETRSNNVLVGAFVLFFTIAIAIFVVWMANDTGGAQRA